MEQGGSDPGEGQLWRSELRLGALSETQQGGGRAAGPLSLCTSAALQPSAVSSKGQI